MILPDWCITDLCKQGMVQPFEEELVNAASLDIRVGTSAQLEVEIECRGGKDSSRELSEGFRAIDLLPNTQDDPFWLYPSECILVSSLETFNIPNHVCAQFRLKSSRGREFYEHMEAGFCDPGWNNSTLTMELKNVNRFKRLPLYPGLRIGQLIFHRLDSIPRHSYATRGRYNGDTLATRSKG